MKKKVMLGLLAVLVLLGLAFGLRQLMTQRREAARRSELLASADAAFAAGDYEAAGALYEELRAMDPETAAAVHINNEKRVLRALELYYATGEKPSAVRARAKEAESPYRSETVGLFFEDRALLYDRINRRVDRMLEAGLIEEARAFFAGSPAGTAVQAIGYKELKPYLDGELPLDTAVENLKRATRRYAKRQLTWFGRNSGIHRIFRDGLTDEEVFLKARAVIDDTGLF